MGYGNTEVFLTSEERETLIRQYLGEPSFYNTPENPQILLDFRKAVNEKIKVYT